MINRKQNSGYPLPSAQKAEWLEVRILLPVTMADALANFLIEQGSNGTVEECPSVFGCRTDKNHTALKAYFKNDGDFPDTLNKIKKYLTSIQSLSANPNSEICKLRVKEFHQQDWNATWKSFFNPIKVTKKIVIKPTWRRYWKKSGEIIIEIDPGMAFGTGTHPTTRLCLNAIEQLIETCPAKKKLSFLDVGTGSGILAIAAHLLGIKKIVAIDIDPVALRTAKKNAALNGMPQAIHFSQTALQKIPGLFTIIAANILPQTLINARNDLTQRLTPGGFLILSGILEEKAVDVKKKFKKNLSLVNQTTEGGWCCLVFQKI